METYWIPMAIDMIIPMPMKLLMEFLRQILQSLVLKSQTTIKQPHIMQMWAWGYDLELRKALKSLHSQISKGQIPTIWTMSLGFIELPTTMPSKNMLPNLVQIWLQPKILIAEWKTETQTGISTMA